MDTSARLELMLWCLGEFEFAVSGTIQEKLQPRAAELLFLLLLARGKGLTRLNLTTRLWGEDSEETRTNLRTQLSKLRKRLGPAAWRIDTSDDYVRFDSSDVAVDAFDFETAMKRALSVKEIRDYEHAIQIYCRPLLPSSTIGAIVKERERLQELYFSGVEALADTLVQLQQPERAIEALNNALVHNPVREHTVRRMLQLLQEDAASADRVIKAYVKAAEHQLIPPNPRLLQQHEQIRMADHLKRLKSRDTGKKSRQPAAPRLDRIPLPAHPLIGRAEDVSRILDRLAQNQFVMLTGPGGVGKSRLALEVAQCSSTKYRDGVVFVGLVDIPAESPDGHSSEERRTQMAEAIAGTLGIQVNLLEHPFDAVARFLANRQMLLILDNCEQILLASIGLVRQLVMACEQLTILVTSRNAFPTNLGAIVEVKPLGMPEAGREVSIEELRGSPAVQLFENVARNHRQDFALTPENADDVDKICRATDGLPLAIHIAASVGFLSISELAQQLTHGLTSVNFPRDSTLSLREQAIDNSIAWSVGIMSESERDLFFGLSVFANGWTREATDAIFPRTGPGDPDALTLLEQLRMKSLVERREVAGRSHYHMLETVRAFASRELRKSQRDSAIAQRHFDYYLQQAELYAGLHNSDAQAEASRWFDEHLENLRSALNYGLTGAQFEKALRLASALTHAFYMNGRDLGAHLWIAKVLELSKHVEPELRRKALHGAGAMAFARRDYAQARQFWQECLELSKELDEPQKILQAQGNLGICALAVEDLACARALFLDCLAGFEKLNDNIGIATAHANLAQTASRELDYPLARYHYEASVKFFRQEPAGHAMILALNNFADVLTHLKLYPEARTTLAEALGLSVRLNNLRNTAHSLSNYVTLEACEEEYERAAIFMGAETALRKKIEAPLAITAQLDYERNRLKIINALGEEQFTAHFRTGEKAPLHELCMYAKLRQAT